MSVLMLVSLLLGLVDLQEGLLDEGPDPDDDVGAKHVHRPQSKEGEKITVDICYVVSLDNVSV